VQFTVNFNSQTPFPVLMCILWPRPSIGKGLTGSSPHLSLTKLKAAAQ
jgi:hypothetical protein